METLSDSVVQKFFTTQMCRELYWLAIATLRCYLQPLHFNLQ